MAALFHEQFPFNPPFDASPYSLGSFDTIATYKGGRYGRAKVIGIGYEYESNEGSGVESVYATYVSDKGRVSLQHFEARNGDTSLKVKVSDTTARERDATVEIQVANNEKSTVEVTMPRAAEDWRSPLSFKNLIVSALLRDKDKLGMTEPDFRKALQLVVRFATDEHVVSVAPIRTRPERTYSQANQAFETIRRSHTVRFGSFTDRRCE